MRTPVTEIMESSEGGALPVRQRRTTAKEWVTASSVPSPSTAQGRRSAPLTAAELTLSDAVGINAGKKLTPPLVQYPLQCI